MEKTLKEESKQEKEQEKEACVKLLIYLANIDNDLSKKETAYYEKAARKLGIKEKIVRELEEQTKTVSIEDLAGQIKADKTKKSLIRELLTVCYADGEYSIVEQNGMRDICILLDYGLADLRKLEAEFEKEAQEKEDDDEVSFDFKRAAGVMAKVGKKVASKTASAIVEEGNDFAHAVAGGIGFVGSKISATLASAKKVREENEALRDELGKMTLSETVKQKVIMQLNDKVAFLKKQLDEERQRNKKNEEIILLLEEQIADLAATIEVAEKAKVE